MTLWIDLSPALGGAHGDCDDVTHGWGCDHLNERPYADPLDEELAVLHERLEEAEDDVTSAEGAVEDAEADLRHAESAADRIKGEIAAVEKKQKAKRTLGEWAEVSA